MLGNRSCWVQIGAGFSTKAFMLISNNLLNNKSHPGPAHMYTDIFGTLFVSGRKKRLWKDQQFEIPLPPTGLERSLGF